MKENLMSIPPEKRMSFLKINKIKSEEELKREFGETFIKVHRI